MSLLTDRVGKCPPHSESIYCPHCGEGFGIEDTIDTTRELQDAKSIKADRQAMAEWGEVLCNSVHHDRFDARRSACHECTVGLFDMLGEGKAPWEPPQ